MFPTTLGDLSTSLYAVLGDCADHRARLRSQPCSETGQSVSMPCSETVLTTNRVCRLMNHSLRCARDLLRSLSDHSLGTAFLDYIPNRARRLINHSLRCAWDLLRLLSNHSLGIGRDNFNFLDLATRLILRLPTSSGTTSVRCI